MSKKKLPVILEKDLRGDTSSDRAKEILLVRKHTRAADLRNAKRAPNPTTGFEIRPDYLARRRGKLR